MHPAPSIILFTVLSGSGYGLLFLIGVLGAAGMLPADGAFGLLAMIISLGMISTGLLASTLHLGHPERAWRALSQWRSSWLSREGVASLITFAPALVLALGWIFFGEIWTLAAVLSAVGAAATVGCTAMIYASLKPIAQWHSAWTLPAFVGMALAGGALLFALITVFYAPEGSWPLGLSALLLSFGWTIKAGYWAVASNRRSQATPESATGLGQFGKVRLLEAPHSEENYLLKEMAFALGRKHAMKLRRLAVACGFVAPLVLLLAADLLVVLPAAPIVVLAVLVGLVGILMERWLFFAEAKHTVTLYYGAQSA